jgi:TolA-binding protein
MESAMHITENRMTGLVLAIVLAVSALAFGETTPQSQLDFANGLFHRGFHSEAIAEYEHYLEQSPDSPDAPTAWLRMGRSAVVTGQYEKAMKAFQNAEDGAATPEQRLEAQASRGEALFFLKRYKDAVGVLKPAVEGGGASETRARALYYLGRAQLESGDSMNAITTLNKLVSDLPESVTAPFAHYHLGFALAASGDVEGAATAFSAAANAKGADEGLRMESRFRAAELYDKLGWTAAALTAYEQLRNEFPGSDYAQRADYGYAWALYHSGRYDEALSSAEAFLKQHADSPQAPGLEYLRGNCFYQQNKFEDALRVYTVLREKHPDSAFAARALYKTAWAQHLTGKSGEAREAVKAFLDKYADSELRGDAFYLLGTIHVTAGDYEEALQEFKQVADNFPDSEFSQDALFKAGECYAQLGLRNEAAATFEDFAKRYPGNPLTEQAMLRSGDARFTAEDFAEALANYAQILEKPGDPRIEEETLYRMAVTYHNMKSYDDSAVTFRKLLEKFPEGMYAVEAHFRIGEYELRQHKDPLKAIEAYQAALNKDKAGTFTVRALQGLASARYEQKDYEQAASQLLQLLRDHPGEALTLEAYLWCSQWLREQERWADAAVLYTALLQAYPAYEERAGAMFILGECQEKTGETDKAIKTYTEALALAPEGQRAVEIHYHLGALYETRKELEKASTWYEKAANMDGGEVAAKARFQLATVQEGLGEHESAARNYMRLAILFVHETLSPEALWRAGNCYRKLGNNDQARSVFEELIADYPESSFAAQAKELLNEPQKATP